MTLCSDKKAGSDFAFAKSLQFFFAKVTGLEVKDFELLTSLDIFNKPLMNEAVYHFKRYEDASLEYTGINMHLNESVGLFNTVISREEYQNLYQMQQESIS